MTANASQSLESLEVFAHLKAMILSNAKLIHGGSKNGRPRNYDIVTSTKARSRGEYRANLVIYDETVKVQGKADVENKILNKSGVKISLNAAMEDLLRKLQEELWT